MAASFRRRTSTGRSSGSEALSERGHHPPIGSDGGGFLPRRRSTTDRGVPAARGRTPLLVEGAIIDKNARIGDGVVITPEGKPENVDGENYYIRDGVVVVPKGAVIPAGTSI